MSDSEKPSVSVRRDYWLQLASQLGAPVPDESEVTDVCEGAEPADAGSGQDALTPERAHSSRPLPARPPSDWGALCDQLGLPAPPAPPSMSFVEPEPVLEKLIELGGSAGRDAESEQIEETGFELSECVSPDDHVLAEVELDELDLAEFDDDLTPVGEMSDGFDVTVKEADRLDDESGRREPAASRRRRRRGRRPTGPQEATAGESPDEALEASTDDEEADGSTSLAEESAVATPLVPEEGKESSVAAPGRRPRRRRRRTARNAEPDAPQGESGELESAHDDREMADARHAEMEFDDDDDEEDDDDELPAGSTHRPKHRKIPTWEEAVGVIVTANLQARAQGDHAKSRYRAPGRRGRGGGDRNP